MTPKEAERVVTIMLREALDKNTVRPLSREEAESSITRFADELGFVLSDFEWEGDEATFDVRRKPLKVYTTTFTLEEE